MVLSSASWYRLAVALLRTLTFRFRLVEAVVIEMSSIYKINLTSLDVKRFRVYIRKRIGEIGLPCRIPASTSENCSVWLLKASRSSLLLRND